MGQDKLVLLVEDDPDTQEVMAMLLEAAGYEVVTARDAVAGLRLIDKRPEISVIITDVNIGRGQDGIGMAEEIRRRGSNASIVVVSGDPEASSARLGTDAIFLPKPYDRHTLLSAVAEACANTSSAQHDAP